MKSSKEIPIFVDSTLGTHLALPISPDITVGALKCKLGQEHLSCFADFGEIKVHALMVKRRCHFYHLPDITPINFAFNGYPGRTWFLHMHASKLQDISLPETSPKLFNSQKTQLRENKQSISNNSDVTGCSQSNFVTTSTNISKEISVTGIISRYFSDFEEVSSFKNLSNHNSEETHNKEIIGSTTKASQFSIGQTSPVESDTGTVCSINNVSSLKREAKGHYRKKKKVNGAEVRKQAIRYRMIFSPPSAEKVQVGKKLIKAANNISNSCSGRKLSTPLFVTRCGKLSAHESDVVGRNIAFEVDDFDG